MAAKTTPRKCQDRAEEAGRGGIEWSRWAERNRDTEGAPSLETQGPVQQPRHQPRALGPPFPPLLVSQHIFLSKGDSLLRAIWCQLFTHLFLTPLQNYSTAYTLPLESIKGSRNLCPPPMGPKINNMGRFSLIPVLTDTLDKE